VESKNDICSDGRTVWVNGPSGCLGRFCPVSGEIFSGNPEVGSSLATTEPKWDLWTILMRYYHEVDVNPDIEPEWSKNGQLA
jgi:hypothetical protein